MLLSAARCGSQALRKALSPRTRYNPFGSNGSQYYSTATPSETTTKQVKKSIWGKLIGAAAVLAGGIYVGDIIINDDFDSAIVDRFRPRLSEEQRKDRPNVVILGSGWGALSMLRKLHTDKFNVTIVSPRNYFLFTPLLASTTSGLLEVRSIMEPIRKYCIRSGRQETRFLEMEATHIDPVNQKVTCEDNSAVKGVVSKIELDYDYLIVSVGAETATFNIPGVPENAIYMKSINDSRRIRDSVMDCFETAVIPGQPSEEIDRLMHFVVVGGGPSGVEYTAELYDFITRDLKKSFPEVADRVKISLIEALPKILPMFDAHLIDYTESKFTETRAINVMTRSAVTSVEPNSLTVKSIQTGETSSVPYGVLVWVTGNAPRPITSKLLKTLGPQFQPVGRGITVDEHLRVKGAKNIFSMGDCSINGKLPATAQVASQEGRYLGRLFNQYAEELYEETKANRNRSADAPIAASVWDEKLNDSNKFVFHSFGSLAYIGNHEAIADFGPDGSKSKGFTTWLLWRSVYLSKLLSVRNRVLVMSDWTRAMIFGRDISRG